MKSFDAASAKAVPGVRDVVEIPNGVAVLAPDFWTAQKGRDALTIDWDEAARSSCSASDILAEYRKLAATPGMIARKDGDAAKALAGAREDARSRVRIPVSRARGDGAAELRGQARRGRCEVWNGEQFQTRRPVAWRKPSA